jgi:hypothetical protein
MDFYEILKNGATEDQINELMNRGIENAKKQFAADLESAKARIEKEQRDAAQQAKNKAELRAEGRAYLINAILAYTDAFDLNEEPYTEEDIDELEQALIALEDMVPLLIKLEEFKSGHKGLELDLGKLFNFGDMDNEDEEEDC